MSTGAITRTTTRRTALTGLGALGVVTTAGACSLLPGGDEEPAGGTDPAPSDAGSDGGGASSEPAPEPGTTFDDWAAAEDLRLVEIDTAAADERTRIEPGPLEREDRFGTWASPGFPDDSPLLTAEPLEFDAEAAAALGGESEARSALRDVLLQTVVEVADTPLLLEADNSRSGEIGPVLVKAFGLEGFDPSAFDPLFEQVPISGAPTPEVGVPEMFDLEPAPYPEDGPRMSVLDTSSLLARVPEGTTFPGAGAALVAFVRGVVPIVREGEDGFLRREVAFYLGVEDGRMNALMTYVVATVPTLAISDAEELPLVEPTEVPEDWQEISFGRLTAAIPPTSGELEEVELGISSVDEDGTRKGGITLFRLPVPSPYLLDAVLYAARAEIGGADLVTAAVSRGGEDGMVVAVRVHVGEEEYRVQVNGVSAEEAPVLAHQVLAGIRVEG